jgi:hypothetical protein
VFENLATMKAITSKTPIAMPTYKNNREYFFKILWANSSALESDNEPLCP